MKWSEMTPEQRNAMVAEEVMGLRLHVAFAQGSDIELDYAIVDDSDGVARIEKMPRYSENMDAAWLVVEALKQRKYEADMKTMLYVYKAYFYDWNIGGEESAAHAATMPEAICIAALRACGIEVEL